MTPTEKIRAALEVTTRKTRFVVRDYPDDKEARAAVIKGEEALALLDTHAVLPIEPSDFSWYFDFAEIKPYTLREIREGYYVVMENPEATPEIGDHSTEDTIFHQKFNNAESAIHCYRVKTAEWLYRAMLTAGESDEI